MAGANTDKFKKISRRWVGQIGSGGVADNSTTTIPLSSTTNLATDTAVVVVIDRVNANGVSTPALEETVIGVVSGSNLINCVRGAEGTAQAHNAGAVVEVLFTAKGWNDLIDGLLVSHNQDGSIASGLTIQSMTLSNTVLNGTVSGTAILDEDDMASDSATKVPSQQSVKAYVDAEIAGIPTPTAGQVKVGSFTRNFSTGAGNVSYTGVGFQPKMVLFFATPTGTTKTFTAQGAMTATDQWAMFTAMNSYNTSDFSTSHCLYLSNASGTNTQASRVSLDADGFTLSWTKVGTPSDTVSIGYIAYG